MQLATAIAAADTLSTFAILLAVVALVVALYYGLTWLYSKSGNILSGVKEVLSTPYKDDTVPTLFSPQSGDVKDQKPKSASALDWVFMSHDDPT